MEQPIPANSVLGKSPPSPGASPPELMEAKKGVGNRRRTTSNTRHRYTTHGSTNSKMLLMLKRQSDNAFSCICFTRRDTANEDQRSQELLHFNSNIFGELVVHRGKSLGENLMR